MSERYSKLFALSENLYSSGSPVVIAAGALQKDNQTGKVFAQLKIRSIHAKQIKAATVRLTPLDTVGKPLGEAFEYQYLDLSVKRDTDFAQKTLIPFKDMTTRAFTVSVSEVFFSDNSVWTASDGAWEPLSPPVTLEKAFFPDNELGKQYREKYGADCKCTFKKDRDLWRCACGAVNRDSETVCHSCQRKAAALAALDIEELKAERDQRLAAEQKKREEELAAAAEKKAVVEKRARRIKKIAMIAAPIVVVVIIAAVLVFSNAAKKQAAYNDALALVEAGQYDDAVAAFTELGNYKDSTEQLTETQYIQAFDMRDRGLYDKAVDVFAELGDYKDSTEQLTETRYIHALDLFDAGEYGEAINAFTELGNYKDSAEQLEKTFRMSMAESIADTYKQLQASTYDSEIIRELKAICETYIPYCGRFEGKDKTDGGLFNLTSDFFQNKNKICWKVEMPDVSMLGLDNGSSVYSLTHRFFVDTPDNDLVVNSSMEVTDAWIFNCIGTATFKDDKIYIEVSDDAYIYYDVIYEKVS